MSLSQQNAMNLDDLPVGEVTPVSQPDYLVIRCNDKIMAIAPKKATFKDVNKVQRAYMSHECELSAAVTFHKMQGKTVQSILLSLNSISGISKKIYATSLPSLCVGCSRVRDHDCLRILPLSLQDEEYLKTLKWDPYLKLFFKNYDENGRWKLNGLFEQRREFIKSVKLKLGITELSDLKVEELQKFASDLDLIVSAKKKPTKQEYI